MGNGVGAIIFSTLSAFATFEKDRIATRIKEVKQRRKDEHFYIDGRRGFGFNVVEGAKVSNVEEKKLLKQMKRMKEKGKTVKEIHYWLYEVKNKKLAYSSLKVALLQC